MRSLCKKIQEKAVVLGDDLLKVDTFLNQQVDTALMEEMGKAFADHFRHENITKVVTIESSGIPPAYAAAVRLHVPMVFIKKNTPTTMVDPLHVQVYSFTKKKHYILCLERGLIKPGDRILFIDDFLANGEAFKAAESLIEKEGASIAGVGICIEKSFQAGRQYIKDKGYSFLPLASIKSLKNGQVLWEDD